MMNNIKDDAADNEDPVFGLKYSKAPKFTTPTTPMTQDKQLESASKILDRYFESENPNNIPDGVYHQAKLAMEEYAAQFQLEHKQVGAGVLKDARELFIEDLKAAMYRYLRYYGASNKLINDAIDFMMPILLSHYLILHEHPQQTTR